MKEHLFFPLWKNQLVFCYLQTTFEEKTLNSFSNNKLLHSQYHQIMYINYIFVQK